jgi:hypothetical protein
MASPNDTSSPAGEGRPTQAIIAAIARHEGVDVTEIEPPAYEPLYSVVNPEALDTLFRTPSDADGVDAYVSLEYAGYDVTVYSDGRVDVTDPSTDEVTPDRLDK